MSGKGNGKALLKKVLKFVGWFFLVIVLVAGVGALGAFMTGRFDPEKIYIQKLTINGVREYVTITQNDTSYTTQVDYAPSNANQLTLTAKILTGEDLIEPLDNVVAGEPLQLKFKKDEHGITQGGEVEIKFIDNNQNSFATLKVLIDVSLDSNHIEVKSNGNDMVVDNVANTLSTNVLTTITQENANKIKISAGYDEMLNSYKGNWSPSENNNLVNLTKLKKMILRYKNDVRVNEFKVTEILGDENYYLIEYLTPATTEEAFTLDVYLYKTYFLESVFEESFANLVLTAFETSNFERDSFGVNGYDKLNAFINDYVYNNSSVDVKNNFDVFNENGLVVLDPRKYQQHSDAFRDAIRDTLDYVFASKRILINVDNIEVTNIVNQNNATNLEFLVLQNYTYSIQDINEKLGITLEGDSGVDRQVLFNTLRDLDIILCYEATSAEYSDAAENAALTKLEKIAATKKFFKIGTTYLKKVDESATDNKFSITKNTAQDGSVSWTLESHSPTHTSDKYYLLYSYTKNDFQDKISFMPEGDKNTRNFEYNESEDAWYQVGNTRSLVVNLDILNRCYNRKYACSPLVVKYTNGVIQYNTTKDDGGNNLINNTGTTSIVLNEVGSVYKNEFDGNSNPVQKVVAHGSEGGVYYKNREFTVGIRTKDNENALMYNNVILRANNINEQMEYTHVKWFVKYTDNVIEEDGIAFTPAANNKYYFKPVVKVKYDDSSTDPASRVNEIPTLYRLKHIADNTFLGGEHEYFMEIGDGDFLLEALNAMDTDKRIPLYAVIVQTESDGQPYEVEKNNVDGVNYVTYNYVAQTSEHTISSAQFIDKLNFYVDIGEGSNVKYVSATTTDGNDVVHNFLDVQQNASSGLLYLTNFNLNESGNPILSNGDWTEGDKVVMQGAVDVERNYLIALTRFYNDFLLSATNPGITWNYAKYDLGTYPIITPTITRNLNIPASGTIASDYYIVFSIANNNANMEGSWSYILTTTTDGNVSNDMMFTKASAIGYFKLSEAPEPDE